MNSDHHFSKKRHFSIGRLAFGLLLIGGLTFFFAFYTPLQGAHRSLAEQHRTAAEREQSLETQLTAARDETRRTKDALARSVDSLEALEKARAARTETQENFGEGVEVALQGRSARRHLEVRRSPGRVEVWIPDIQVFRTHQVAAHKPGGVILCEVANALKGNKGLLHVEVHFGKARVTNPFLKADFPTSWALTSARALDAATWLVESCGVEENRISAVARGHAAVGKLPKRATGFVVLRIDQQG